MTSIEVPDWVVEAARAAVREFWQNYKGGHDCGEYDAAMKAAITAALGAWVEIGGYQSRLIAKRTGKLINDWREVDKELFDAVGGKTHEGADFRCEYRTLYTLRQEKPE